MHEGTQKEGKKSNHKSLCCSLRWAVGCNSSPLKSWVTSVSFNPHGRREAHWMTSKASVKHTIWLLLCSFEPWSWRICLRSPATQKHSGWQFQHQTALLNFDSNDFVPPPPDSANFVICTKVLRHCKSKMHHFLCVFLKFVIPWTY